MPVEPMDEAVLWNRSRGLEGGSVIVCALRGGKGLAPACTAGAKGIPNYFFFAAGFAVFFVAFFAAGAFAAAFASTFFAMGPLLQWICI